MKRTLWIPLVGLAVAGVWQIGGCGVVVPTIPLPIQLGSNSAFNTVSGTPSAKTFTTNFSNTSGVDLGSGNLVVDPSAVSVTSQAAKTLLDIPDTCDDACAAAAHHAFDSTWNWQAVVDRMLPHLQAVPRRATS